MFSRLHDKIDRDVLAANPKLRAVTSMTISPDNIDVAAATKLGIPVTVLRRGDDLAARLSAGQEAAVG